MLSRYLTLIHSWLNLLIKATLLAIFVILSIAALSQGSGGEDYKKAIELADKYFADKDYVNAKSTYQYAKRLNPKATYPDEQLQKVMKVLRERMAKLDEYDAALGKAEDFFIRGEYEKAIEQYRIASEVMPDEDYPKNKIAEIEGTLREKADNEQAYSMNVADGDQFFEAKKFGDAIAAYQEALKVFPDEIYPNEQIKKAKAAIEEYREIQKKYDEFISEADRLFDYKYYAQARPLYEKALEVSPDDQHARKRLNQTAKLLEKKNRYQQLVDEADNLYIAKKYEQAKSKYQQAIKLFPEEGYPKTIIEKINSTMAKNSSKQELYDKAIADADRFFSDNDYENARSEYKNAQEILPDESYPGQRIAEINNLLKEREVKRQQYELVVKQGDQLFQDKQFAEAKEKYSKARELLPSESYPGEQLARISELLNAVREKQASYDLAIKQGDELLAEEDFQKAKEKYKLALSIDGQATYPQQKITEIENTMEALAEKAGNYKQAIEDADAYFSQQKYDKALASYQTASGIKPGESYPKKKITEINEILETNSNYENLIAKADEAYNSGKYAESKQHYISASAIKPEETYPKEQMAKIDGILADQKQKDQQYNQLITSADQLYDNEHYAEAREKYEQAADIKPGEAYPGQKVTEIDNTLKSIAEKSANYEQAIENADNFFSQEKYDKALASYQTASGIKPGESYPKKKITEINEILETNSNYENLIAKADEAYNSGKYAESKQHYTSASAIKPEETYPKEQIAKIDGILADQKQIDQQYNQSITSADQLYDNERYVEAKENYEQAADLKPGETYPRTRIDEIEKLISARKEKQASYEDAIAEADRLYQKEQWEQALQGYTTAKSIKPDEAYPAEKITEINTRLEQIEATNTKYNSLITTADNLFNSKQYAEAKTQYQEAIELKPDQNHPENRLEEIENIVAGIERTDQQYQKLINSADGLFNSGKMEEARSEYNEALALKPDEAYPKQKIGEIETKLATIRQQNQQYEEVIRTADELFDAENYAEAKVRYQEALEIKPGEKHPKQRISETEARLAEIAKKKREREKGYQDNIDLADGFYDNQDYENAKTYYEKAMKVKPGETYPSGRIEEINALLQQEKEKTAAYAAAITEADRLMNSGQYEQAIEKYKEAAGIKPDEEYPGQKIKEITALQQEKEQQRINVSYDKALASAEMHFKMKDYEQAKQSYREASDIKPGEQYPRDRIEEINRIAAEERKKVEEAYQQEIASADKLFYSNIYDEAIDHYEKARKIKPGESYPDEMINKIRDIIEKNSIIDLVTDAEVIPENTEKKLEFSPVSARDRKKNYLLIKARNTSSDPFKVIVSYGENSSKKGGLVLRIPGEEKMKEYIVRIGAQYNWFNADNNWISLYPEGGSLEVELVKISRGD